MVLLRVKILSSKNILSSSFNSGDYFRKIYNKMSFPTISFYATLILGINLNYVHNNENQLNNNIENISDAQIAKFSGLSDQKNFRKTLDKILIPRIVGTEGHKKVREFIIDSLEDLNWQVDLDIFEDVVPIMGKLKFQNIIATQNPSAKRFLTLACHYDSKYIPDVEFLGAIDSAVPCAMLINLAKNLDTHLKQSQDSDVSLMFVFFDGEEAFKEWSSTDSIYGARNLAKKWNDSGFLKRLDMLVLLDLLGAPDPIFYSFFKETDNWYALLVDIENRLSSNGFLEKHVSSGVIKSKMNRYFQPETTRSFIEDDHIPFLKLGVPILHIIPVRFPDVWHTPQDNLGIVDFTTVENLSKILRCFVGQYLKINV